MVVLAGFLSLAGGRVLQKQPTVCHAMIAKEGKHLAKLYFYYSAMNAGKNHHAAAGHGITTREEPEQRTRWCSNQHDSRSGQGGAFTHRS